MRHLVKLVARFSGRITAFVLVHILGPDRLQRLVGKIGSQAVDLLQSAYVRDMMCREGMAHMLQQAAAMNTWSAEELIRYRREMNTPEALELSAQLNSTYAGSTVERINVQELPDGSSSFSVETNAGTLAFQAPVLQFSDSTREVSHAS